MMHHTYLGLNYMYHHSKTRSQLHYIGRMTVAPDKSVSGAGKEASFDNAQFIFSQDAGHPDTQRIFESTAYLDEHLSVFHANFISECVKRQSMEAVPLGKYILLPEDVQEVVRSELRIKFLWETDGNISDNQSVHSKSEDETPGPQMSNRTSQKRSREPDQEATSSKIRNQSGSKSYDKQKENQSGQKQNTEDQSNTKTHVKSMKDKQSSQFIETSQSKKSQKNNKMNTANMEFNDKDQQILKESTLVENEVRRSPRKHGQTKTENQTQEKIRKLSDSTVVTAEREEVWRLENLAKVMDRIDEFAVGNSGYEVFDKRRKHTVT